MTVSIRLILVCKIILYHQVFAATATQKCSPWADSVNLRQNNTHHCICNPDAFFHEKLLSCHDQTLTIGVCLTRNGSNGSAVYGQCPYSTKLGRNSTAITHGCLEFPTITTVQLDELEDLICGPHNRQGLLCSRCKPGYGPAVYAFGFSCADCNVIFSGWCLYLFLQLFPLTVFYVIVIIFHVKAVSPPFISFVILCQSFLQMERSAVYVRTYIESSSLSTLFKITQTLCGFWNLDFFRHVIPLFCVDSSLNNLHTLWLDFISAYYPLLLIAFSYIVIQLHACNFKPVVLFWKPFHKCCVRIRRGLDPTSSIVNAFATFLILSISKVIFLSGHLIYTMSIYRIGIDDENGYSYYEPSIPVEDAYATHLIAVVIVNVFLFAILPTILLCLYPTRIFRKVLKCFRLSQSTSLLIFLDVFQGHFKNGTSGTRDYRALSGLYIILEVFIAVIFSDAQEKIGIIRATQFRIPISLLVVVLLFSTLQPYKGQWNNHLTVINLVLTLIVISGFTLYLVSVSKYYMQTTLLIMNILLLLPHVVLYSYAMYKVAKNFGINKRLNSIMKTSVAKIRSTRLFLLQCLMQSKRAEYEQVNSNDEFGESLPDRLENPQYYHP